LCNYKKSINYLNNFFILFFASKGPKNKLRFIFYIFLNLGNRLKIIRLKNKDFRLGFEDIEIWIGLSSGELGGYIQLFIENIDERVSDFKANKGDVIFDIGSNIGLFALKQAWRIGAKGKIWAFEPNAFVFRRLIKNLRENNITNTVTIQKAVTSKTGKIKFVVNANITPKGKPLHVREISKNKNIIMEVESVTLDDFVLENNIRKINLMKIDVEGEEYEVLKGASQRTLFITEKIVLEYHSEELKEKLIPLLKDKGFSLILEDDKNFVLYFKNG